MQFSKAVIAASTLAVDLGNWTLSCGSSCTDGTVIATGDAQYADFGDCQVLDQAYQYCYLDCDGVCDPQAGDRWFIADLSGTTTCSTSSPVWIGIQPGECAEGPFLSYFVKLNA